MQPNSLGPKNRAGPRYGNEIVGSKGPARAKPTCSVMDAILYPSRYPTGCSLILLGVHGL